jgi:hypothetical protein
MSIARFPFFQCLTALLPYCLTAQPATTPDIPAVYSNMEMVDGHFSMVAQDTVQFPEVIWKPRFTLKQMIGNPQGTKSGLSFDFGPDFYGTLYFGFIPYGDSKYPHPVYFRSPSPIDSGLAVVNIADQLSGLYDMVGWEKSGRGTIGYRAVDSTGLIVYDGIIAFRYQQDSFSIAPTIIEGPFINKTRPDGATISFTTNGEYIAQVRIGERRFMDKHVTQQHEI